MYYMKCVSKLGSWLVLTFRGGGPSPIAGGLAGRHVPVVYRGLVWFIAGSGSCAVSVVIGGGGMRHLFYVTAVCSASQMAQRFTICCDDGFSDDDTSDWMIDLLKLYRALSV